MRELDFAWQLVDVVEGDLDDISRADAYVALGAGDAVTAIALALRAVVTVQRAVGADVVTDLIRRLDTYHGQPFEPVVRQLIGQIKTSAPFPLEPVATHRFLEVVKPYRRPELHKTNSDFRTSTSERTAHHFRGKPTGGFQ